MDPSDNNYVLNKHEHRDQLIVAHILSFFWTWEWTCLQTTRQRQLNQHVGLKGFVHIKHNWLRQWLSTFRQYTITWSKVYQDRWCHITSPGQIYKNIEKTAGISKAVSDRKLWTERVLECIITSWNSRLTINDMWLFNMLRNLNAFILPHLRIWM